MKRTRTSGGKPRGKGLGGTQTLVRGLDIIEVVARGTIGLVELAKTVSLTRSTTHRLAGALVDQRYLKFSRGTGYSLGPRLLELGYIAGQQSDLVRVARTHLEGLAARTGDTVHLGVLDGMQALYLDKIPGTRRVEISSRIGERQPLRSTGLGKALLLDFDEPRWRECYDFETRRGDKYDVNLRVWLRRMSEYAKKGYAFDLEENEDRIRCVAAPVRDVTGSIVGSISIASAAQYMDDARMHSLVADVGKTAKAISVELGFDPARARPTSRALGSACRRTSRQGG